LPHDNLYEKTFAQITDTAIKNNDLLTAALSSSTINTVFPNTSLGSQMKMIARLIGARNTLGHKRQIFFASVGGYDLHGDQLTPHSTLLGELSGCMKAFYDAINNELAISDKVTTFTASDFGRTLSSNGTGSDHGWGNHQIIMGGAVQGKRLYGTFPTLAVNGPDDTSTGRWIPTMSVDEYSATLARWFGVSNTDMPTVFPNLTRFARPDL